MSVLTSKDKGGEILELSPVTELFLNTNNWKISLEPCLRKRKKTHQNPLKEGVFASSINFLTIFCSDTMQKVRKIFRADLML